ncbi:hypothetical protein NpPPO83_00005308 [Neofusicoccum parvum]|uniref:Uncharacterized protein n=1 Tax=Neofusicoccum parvum TaxID=310453 RepID=A0ACB5S640_9PEZI|nr:hypothetical protein NpPPO83_00005308 [Neofusicoccum parvum]
MPASSSILLALGGPWDSRPPSLPAEQVVDLPVTNDPAADHAEAARWQAAGIHVQWVWTPSPQSLLAQSTPSHAAATSTSTTAAGAAAAAVLAPAAL